MAVDNNSDVVKEIFSATKYMIDASLNEAPFDKTVTGMIVGGSNKKNYYHVMIYGKNYDLPSYINNTLEPNTPVNVMVPQNNMDFAFIYAILGGESNIPPEGSVIHADQADYATKAGYASTVAVATDEIVGGILSSSGKNHVSVSKTGIATVNYVDKADTATDATNAVNAQNAVHANNADNATQANSALNAQHADEADEATHAITADIADTVENVPVATETRIGGIVSSSGPGHVQVDENGVATVPDAGGIKEVPVATESVVGGVISSTNSGKLAVESTGEASIIDAVLIKDSGVIEKPDSFGEGPWKIICTEDTSPDDPQTGVPSGGSEGDVLTKSSSDNYATQWSEFAPKATFATTAGNGVPTGGQPGQMLKKTSGENYAFQWVNSYSNPNLLDNWYLIDPINQRNIGSGVLWGDRTYASIDRWHAYEAGTTKWTTGIGVTLSGNTANSIIEQYFRPSIGFNSKNYTCTVIGYTSQTVAESPISLHFQWNTASHQDFQIDGTTIRISYRGTDKSYIRITNLGTLDYTIYAIKLELGNEQTLCYTSDGAKWEFLDSPPNKATELVKCQRWMYVIPTATEYAGVTFNPPTMYIALLQILNMEPIRVVSFAENGSFYLDCNGNRKQCFRGTDFTDISFAKTSNLVTIKINSSDTFFTSNKLSTAYLWGLSDNLVISSEL